MPSTRARALTNVDRWEELGRGGEEVERREGEWRRGVCGRGRREEVVQEGVG